MLSTGFESQRTRFYTSAALLLLVCSPACLSCISIQGPAATAFKGSEWLVTGCQLCQSLTWLCSPERSLPLSRSCAQTTLTPTDASIDNGWRPIKRYVIKIHWQILKNIWLDFCKSKAETSLAKMYIPLKIWICSSHSDELIYFCLLNIDFFKWNTLDRYSIIFSKVFCSLGQFTTPP